MQRIVTHFAKIIIDKILLIIAYDTINLYYYFHLVRYFFNDLILRKKYIEESHDTIST